MTEEPAIAAAKEHIRQVRRTPERLIAAATASVDEAAKLALPSNDPDRGVEHDAKQGIDRIAKALERERTANRELREAVVTYGRRMTWLMRTVIALGLMSALVGGWFTAQQMELAERNREAIRVACTLLTNAILESGAGGLDQPARSPAARAQRENTAILVQAITRNLLTASERKQMAENARVIAKAGGVISTPDCDAVARHPERVRELELGETKEPARRSPAIP